MKIAAISDMHGLLPKIEASELLFICGDIIPLSIQRDVQKSLKWLNNEFLNWVNNLPIKQVILIAGNHDFVFERLIPETYNLFRDTKVKYLFCENYEYISDEGLIYSIYGSPYCEVFGNWPFMVESKTIKEKMSNMRNDIDFLLVHNAPTLGGLGLINAGWQTGKEAGSLTISDVILQKKPKYVFAGHIHSGNHNLANVNGISLTNVSLLDESYEFNYKPFYLEV